MQKAVKTENLKSVDAQLKLNEPHIKELQNCELTFDLQIHWAKENEHPSIASFFNLSFGVFLIRLVSSRNT
jgi:hypothetical protein